MTYPFPLSSPVKLFIPVQFCTEEKSRSFISIYFPDRLFFIASKSATVFITVYPCEMASASVSLYMDWLKSPLYSSSTDFSVDVIFPVYVFPVGISP